MAPRQPPDDPWGGVGVGAGLLAAVLLLGAVVARLRRRRARAVSGRRPAIDR